eukprot:7823125-Prorocentrum_lima.AAC.1
MTSSLVGSEMCIRDRFKADDARYLIHRMISPTTAVLADAAIGNTDLKLCLLYTSDAADDM